ncbi:hypothetical protein Glove_352g57 [Diversispora epigaea]|uniref:BACK domain-containing protein n=1 Tax=Diversispora epigaea TaxID=1348612 RepID=A0A397HCK6_9GLOM|nr:hypothetical protein Glove_352g57 [Diversispora epigaea]
MKSFTAHSSILKRRYIYGGIINSETAETKFILDLLIATDEFELEELTKELKYLLIETKSSWLRTHFSLVYRSIFSENNFKDLKNFCNDIIVKYIYGGIINSETAETKFILDLLIATDEFELEELTKELKYLLIETKSSWLRTHFSLVYRSIFSENNFKDLKNFCNDIIVKYPNLIFEAEDFTSLQESALISILERDYLQLEEIKVWEFIIKWGNAQNSNLPANLNEWIKENFTTLKATLQHCLPLPLIRYFYIPSTDVLNKVKTYKKLLDKQLWDDLKQYLIDPDQPVKSIILSARLILNSAIITNKHMAEISSWIDYIQRTYYFGNLPYKFELILRSINGFEPQTFWDTSQGHSNTVIIVKVKGTDEILGGYDSLTWDSTNSNYNTRGRVEFRDGNWSQQMIALFSY